MSFLSSSREENQVLPLGVGVCIPPGFGTAGLDEVLFQCGNLSGDGKATKVVRESIGRREKKKEEGRRKTASVRQVDPGLSPERETPSHC